MSRQSDDQIIVPQIAALTESSWHFPSGIPNQSIIALRHRSGCHPSVG